jgi:hypothetical protein
MPLERVGDLPGARLRDEDHDDLEAILDELAATPTEWFKIDEDPVDPERMHKKRYRFTQTLRKACNQDFEFAVRKGALYGRKVNDD